MPIERELWRAALGAAIACAACARPDSGALLVRLDDGPVTASRTVAPDILRLLGVPYAAPPLGALRWAPPRRPVPWTGARAATDAGPACIQDTTLQVGFFRNLSAVLGRAGSTYGTGLRTSEDCLTLNAWFGGDSAVRRPVMVWFHGGSNLHGWAGDPFFDGTGLARLGAVVITANYRLGAFGFLAHPHGPSGNYGLLDQLAVLQWVRRNASRLGGDSTRVTVFGQSAGATDIACLLTSPMLAGLAHRAILQSGACVSDWPERSTADSAGIALARALHLEDPASPEALTALRAVPAAEILAAAGDSLHFDPTVDGWLFPAQPRARLERGEVLRMPVLLGSNAQEAASLIPFADPVKDPARRLRWSGLVTKLSAEWVETPARVTARALRRAGAPVYLYLLDAGPASPAGLGSFHGAELPLVFETNPEGWTWDSVSVAVGAEMRRAWVQFAATGDPNPVPGGAWLPFGEREVRWTFGGPAPGPRN